MKVKYLMIGVLATVLPVTSAMAFRANALNVETSSAVKLSGAKFTAPNLLILTGTGFGPVAHVKVGTNVGDLKTRSPDQINVLFYKINWYRWKYCGSSWFRL